MNKKVNGYGIELDFTNIQAEIVGNENGLSKDEFSRFKGDAEKAHAAVEQARKDGKLGFTKLPYTADADLENIQTIADEIARDYSDFVVLGIGGSALGNIALQSALNHTFYNMLQNESRPRLFVLDNVDPELIADVLDVLPLNKTFFNVITKSGATAETMSQFLIFRQLIIDRIGKNAFKKQFLATTDPEKGFLRKIARDEELRTLPIPSDVGGRFSVLTPVGLLSAAVTGIDIKELILGARKMDELCQKNDPLRNPAVMSALIQYLMDMKKKKPMTVMIPYVQSLRDIADWYRQLLAESIGKKSDRTGKPVHVGPTPIKALGATDQHSQIQLYMEGPVDKLIMFIGVKSYRQDVSIPLAYEDIAELSYLGNQTLGKLIKAEQNSTEVALARNGRPNYTITLDEVNPRTVGALMYLFEYQIAVAGELYNINAFDQPGVEEGKNLTYGMMGRAGYEDKKRLVEEAFASKSGATIISWNA